MLKRLLEKRRDPILPLFLTVFFDVLGFGIAIPVLAALFLEDSMSILPPEVPVELRRLGYGLLIASYPFAQFIGAPVFGALSDRHGRKSLLLITLFCTAMGYLLFAVGVIFHNIPLLFISRLVDGFTGGNISIVFSAIADTNTDPASRTRKFGMIGMAFGLGFILGPYIGGKLADPHVFPFFNAATPFLFCALLLSFNTLLTMWLFRETNSRRIPTPISFTAGVRNIVNAFTLSHLRTMFIVVFLLTLGFNFFAQFFPVLLIEWYHFTPGGIADFFAYIGLWVAFTQGVLIRPLSVKISSPTVLRYTTAFLGIALLTLLAPRSFNMLYFVVAFIAIFQGITQPNTITVISSLSDDSSQGEIMGISQSVQALAMIIPPLVSGIVANIHLSLPIVISGALTLAGWLYFVLLFRGPAEKKYHEISTIPL